MSVWLEAARPKTLPAAVAPVLVGTAVASTFVAWRFVAALVVSLALQVAVNYANDYFDGIAGIDTAGRVGPRRAVAAGLVPPAAMKRATAVALGVAGLAGLGLAAAAGWELLLVGAAAMLAALGYSGGTGPTPPVPSARSSSSSSSGWWRPSARSTSRTRPGPGTPCSWPCRWA